MLTVAGSSSGVLLPNQAVAPQLPSKRDIRLETGEFVVRLALTGRGADGGVPSALSGVQPGDE